MYDKLKAFFASFFTVSSSERDALQKAFDDAPVGSMASVRAELALTKYDFQHAKDAAPKRLRVKDIRLSEKGGINIMGLRRFPVNLYAAELEAIVEAIEDGRILNFLETHKGQLSLQKPPADS